MERWKWSQDFEKDMASAQFGVDVHPRIPDETLVRLQMEGGKVLGVVTVGDIRRLKEALRSQEG